jgi:hypothetical protein
VIHEKNVSHERLANVKSQQAQIGTFGSIRYLSYYSILKTNGADVCSSWGLGLGVFWSWVFGLKPFHDLVFGSIHHLFLFIRLECHVVDCGHFADFLLMFLLSCFMNTVVWVIDHVLDIV